MNTMMMTIKGKMGTVVKQALVLMSFPDQASACAIGSLVLERLNKNLDFSITRQDIEKLSHR